MCFPFLFPHPLKGAFSCYGMPFGPNGVAKGLFQGCHPARMSFQVWPFCKMKGLQRERVFTFLAVSRQLTVSAIRLPARSMLCIFISFNVSHYMPRRGSGEHSGNLLRLSVPQSRGGKGVHTPGHGRAARLCKRKKKRAFALIIREFGLTL